MNGLSFRSLIIFFALSFIIVAQCKAQMRTDIPKDLPSPAEKKPPKVKGKIKTKHITRAENKDSIPGLVNLTISANATCYLYINDDSIGVIGTGNNTIVNLPLGSYKLKALSINNGNDIYEGMLNISSHQAINYTISLKEIIAKNRLQEEQNRLALKRREDSIRQKEEENLKFLGRSDIKAINALKTDMVLIEGATFKMGSNAGENDEMPEHSVKVESLYFGKYEVTQQQWEDIMGKNPSYLRGCPQCPVENVSWEDVTKFINKINQISSGKFRLPTEAEWEYVAKKGFDNKIDFKKFAWFSENANRPYPVNEKDKEPNKLGIYHLFGNVAEWCSDWYDKGYYKNSPDADPIGPASGNSKIIRGGSYADNAIIFRPSFRDKHKPSGKSKYIGFRLVRSLN